MGFWQVELGFSSFFATYFLAENWISKNPYPYLHVDSSFSIQTPQISKKPYHQNKKGAQNIALCIVYILIDVKGELSRH